MEKIEFMDLLLQMANKTHNKNQSSENSTEILKVENLINEHKRLVKENDDTFNNEIKRQEQQRQIDEINRMPRIVELPGDDLQQPKPFLLSRD